MLFMEMRKAVCSSYICSHKNLEVRSDGLLKPTLPFDRGEAFCSAVGQREDRAPPFLTAFPGRTLSLLGMRRRKIGSAILILAHNCC